MSADSPHEIDEDCLETVVINPSTHELKKIESSNGGVLDPQCNVQDIILDCSRINTLDGTGLDTIKSVSLSYQHLSFINICLLSIFVFYKHLNIFYLLFFYQHLSFISIYFLSTFIF